MSTLEKQILIYHTLIDFAQSHNGATPTKLALWRLCSAKGLNVAYKNFYKHLSKIKSIEYRDDVLVVVDSSWLYSHDKPIRIASPAVRVRKIATNPSSRTAFIQIGERDGFCCAYCGTDKTLEVDHVTPRSLGGTDNLDNLQLLCRPCNLNKSNGVQ